MEPPRSRYRRVEQGWEGSAEGAQQAADSHSQSRALRRPSPGKWGRRGDPARRASPPRRPFGGAGPIQDGVTGSDLQGDGRTPYPSPAPAGASPHGSRLGPRPRPQSCTSKAPRPRGRPRQCGVPRPPRPPLPRAPPHFALLRPPALGGLHRPPRPTRPRRLRPRAPRPSRSLAFSEGQQLDFTGIGRGCRRRLWLVLRPSGSCFPLSRLLAISSHRVSSFPGFPPPPRLLA